MRGGFFRRLAALLIASTLVLLLAGSALAAIDATRPMVSEPRSERSWVPGDIPDLALLIAGGPGGSDAIIDAVVVPIVKDIPGVTAVATDRLPNGRLALHVSIDDVSPDRTTDSVVASVEQLLPDRQVSVGGRAVVDRDLVDRLDTGMIVAIVPVLVLLGLLISAAIGVRLGLTTVGVVAASTALGGVLGARATGAFDGTLATTAIPAVLVAALVSTVLTFRLLDWFKHPQGSNQSEMIRRSVSHLLPEVVMIFGGLGLTALVMEFVGSGRSAATVVAVGGFIAAIVTLSALPPILVTMPPVPNDDDYRLFRLPTPDGRDFPLSVLAGFAGFLLLLGLFALRVPGETLLDSDALPAAESSRRVSEQLVQSGGDPSDAIIATIDGSTTPAQLDHWAEAVSELPLVGWVETATGRYESGALVSESTAPDRFATTEEFFAIVSPTVGGRSEAAQALVDEIETAAGLPASPTLAGVPVDAAAVAASGADGLWILVALLALGGGVTVFLLLGDLFLSFVTVGLRLLGTGASLGVFYIASAGVSGGELQVLALIVNVGVGLFEVGFLRRIGIGRALEGSPVVLVGDALRREGRAAVYGLGVAALIGLGFLVSDLEVARRLGLAVSAGVVIELLIGIWLLRPVVLGERAAGVPPQRSAVRRALRAEAFAARSAANPSSVAVDPEWRRVVGGLLRSEFDCQAFPETAELSTIFVEGTPLYREVSDHNRRLLDTGLRVAGKGPVLRSLRAVDTSSPVTLAVTVEHPVRYLVDPNGRQIGQRTAEMREGMLWLVQDPSGRYRIAEAVDLGHAEGVELTPAETPSLSDLTGRMTLPV